MKIEEIERLVKLVTDRGLNELHVHQGEFNLLLKYEGNQRGTVVAVPAAAPVMPAMVAPLQQQVLQPLVIPPKAEAKQEKPEDGTVIVRSPFVGTFYRAPAPNEPPFVKEGDKVKKGQTLCIVEAMKLMNEIESEVDGVVVAIHVGNETPVEYEQPLFSLGKP